MADDFTVTPATLPSKKDDADFTVTPAKLPKSAVAAPAAPKKPVRPSDPGKQFVAGITDIATGIPSFLGLAGAGLETLYKEATNDKDIGQNFMESLTDKGLDQKLFEAGTSGMDYVNELLGIDAPVSTEDQAARLIGSFAIPIPSSVLAGTAGKTAAMLTPMVRIGGPKAFGKFGTGSRLGAEMGLAAGMDQGARALLDEPMILSQEALTGEKDFVVTPQDLTKPVSLTDADLIGEDFTVTPAQILTPEQQQAEAIAENERQLKAIEDNDRMETALIVGGIAALTGGVIAKKVMANRARNASAATRPVEVTPTTPIATKIYGNVVDSRAIETDLLRKSGASEESIKENLSQMDTVSNSLGISQQYVLDGVARFTGKRADMSLSQLHSGFKALPKETQEVFNLGMKAKSELAQRMRSATNRPIGLFNAQQNRMYSNGELRQAIDALERNPILTNMERIYRQNLDNILDDAVGMKVITPQTVQSWRDDFTLNGRSAYMPAYSVAPQESILAKTKKALLPDRTKRAENEISRWESRTGEAFQGTKYVEDPFVAANKYIYETVDYMNRNAATWNLLRRLGGLSPAGTRVQNFNPNDTNATLLGKLKREVDPATNIPKKDVDWNEEFLADRSNIAKDIRNKFDIASDELVTVRYGGDEHVFHVPDQALRDIITYRPELYGLLKTGNFFKNIFTQGTTGNASFFAPISNMYSGAQIAFNAATTKGDLSQLHKTAIDNVTGTWHLFANRASKTMADNLNTRILSNTGVAKLMPRETLQALRNNLQRRYERSIVNPILRESGAFQTSVGTTDVMKFVEDSLPNVQDSWANRVADKLPNPIGGTVEMAASFPRQTWHMWKHLNEALREGPALGRALREIGDTGGYATQDARRRIRQGTQTAKDFAGDFSRVGASPIMKGVNATVPFSGAMIQSWNSIGKAVKSNWKWAMPALTGTVGLPTATELGWVAGLDQMYPEMGYNDYYWNTLTTNQRISNFFLPLPGLPPEQAMLVPLAPELSVFKAATIEGLDAIFNFSNVGKAGELGNNGDNMLEAYYRVLNIPIPPPIKAAATVAGINLTVGPTEAAEGEGTDYLTGRPLIGGNRFGTDANSRDYRDMQDTMVGQLVNDIFGTAGTTFLSVANAFNTTSELSMGEGADQAIGEFGYAAKKQARYLQPLFGNAISPTTNNETARGVRAKSNALKTLSEEAKEFATNGITTKSGELLMGNTAQPSDDLMHVDVAYMADDVMSGLNTIGKQLTDAYEQIKVLGNSDRDPITKKPISVGEKYALIDQQKLRIQNIKHQQMLYLDTQERNIQDYLRVKYNKPDLDFTFNGFTARSKAKGLIVQSPR